MGEYNISMGFLDNLFRRGTDLSVNTVTLTEPASLKKPVSFTPNIGNSKPNNNVWWESCGAKQQCGKCTKCQLLYNYYNLEYLIHYLPNIKAVANLKTSLIIGKGLELQYTGTDKLTDSLKAKIATDNQRLQDWLSSVNNIGNTNLSIIKTAIEDTEIYGHAGIQLFTERDILTINNIHSFNFAIVLLKGNKGSTKVLFYFIDLENIDRDKDYKDIIDSKTNKIKETDKQYYLLPDEFIHLKTNSDNEYGVSPFVYDRGRIQLLLDGLLQNVNDINSEKFGKVLLKTQQKVSNEDLGLSNELAKANPEQRLENLATALNQGRQGLNSLTDNSESGWVMNKAYFEDITQLARQIKGTDYLDWINTNSTLIACGALGIHPDLLGGIGRGYSSSLKAIIDFTITNYIKPVQVQYEAMLTQKLLTKLNFDLDYKLVFKPLDFSDPKEIADIYSKTAETAKKMVDIGVPLQNVHDFLESEIPSIVIENQSDITLIGSGYKMISDLNQDLTIAGDNNQ